MILDKSRLRIEKYGSSVKYIYDFPTKNQNEKLIFIILIAIPNEGNISYVVTKSVEGIDGTIFDDNTRFSTDDLKEAWEKFEDYFEETQKEENPEQNQEEPEVQILCMSVNKDGHSFVFLQKQDGNQELIFELKIDNYDIINTKPKFATLDFTGNASIQEPFNTEWSLGLVDDITFADAQIDSSTYIVALKSVDQPGQNQEGEAQDNKDGEPNDKGDKGEPGDDKGKPTDEPGDDKGKPTDEPGDDKGKPTDEPGDDKGKPTDEPGDDKGEPGDDKQPWPQPQPKPGDDGEPFPFPKPGDDGEPFPFPKPGDDGDLEPGEPKPKVTPVEFSSAVKEISEKTGISPDNIEGALRTERTFDTFLTLQKVDVNELKDKLNASTLTRNQFIKQVVNDFKKI